MADAKEPLIATIGLEAITAEVAAKASAGEEFVIWENDIERLMENAVVPSVRIILCGPPPVNSSFNEMAQFLRMQYPQAAIFLTTTNRTGFQRKAFVKNGFTDAFLIPLDSGTLSIQIKEEIARSKGLKTFRSVKLVDLQPDTKVDFDTYIHLPANGKHLKYAASGDAIDKERMEKLKKHKVGNLHVDANDMQKFYQWTANQLMNLGKSEALSETEKRERMQTAIRELITDLFQDSSADQSFEKGKQVVSDCQQVVKSYILASVSGADNKFYNKLLQLGRSENTIYTLAANTSTFAALFSMALGIGKPEELAMAGLLHDIGLAELSAEIQSKPASERTPEEQAAYERHPKISVQLVQTRKMVVPEIVLKIIAQHHERYDGKGYPEGLRAGKIRPEAQLLAISDEMCEAMMDPGDGRVPLNPVQALQKIYDAIPGGEDGHRYDPDLVRRLYDVFKFHPQPGG